MKMTGQQVDLAKPQATPEYVLRATPAIFALAIAFGVARAAADGTVAWVKAKTAPVTAAVSDGAEKIRSAF